jgi:uncharacterized lipoprotein YmbA
MMAALLLLTVFLLQGCISLGGTSPATEYYLLTAEAEGPAGSVPIEQSDLVSVGPVVLPDFLDRPQIVTRDGARLQFSDLQRWAEPLDIGVLRVVSEDLERLHPGWQTVNHLTPLALRANRSLRLEIRRLDGPPGQVVVDIRWLLSDPASAAAPDRGRYQQTLPLADTSAQALVRGVSKALAQLSSEIPLR